MIWCVEDDSSIRDIEVYALTSTGFEAKGFEDGDSFWNALQSEKPELVVLDVMLPGKDGVTLLKLMKANEAFADIPVIMATAKGSEYDKIQSLDLGADDYLVKPFGIMEMVSRVKAVLRRCKRSAPSNLLKIDGLVLVPTYSTGRHSIPPAAVAVLKPGTAEGYCSERGLKRTRMVNCPNVSVDFNWSQSYNIWAVLEANGIRVIEFDDVGDF